MSLNKLIGFNDLISGTLADFIDAEHQSARSTLEMIESLGFEKNEVGETTLKMVSFMTTSYDEHGKPKRLKHHVPQLSLLPIPLMKTSEAELEFGVKINDFEETDLLSSPILVDPHDADIQSKRFRMKASIGRMDVPNGNTNGTSKLDMRVKLKLEPADFPAGITNLLHLLERSTNTEEIEAANTIDYQEVRNAE